MILKGDISITDNIDLIKNIIVSGSCNVKVIDLEEVPTIPTESPNVIVGNILLPPIDSMIAAVNGDEPLFYKTYADHFNLVDVHEFICIMVTYLYRGGNFIIYYPEDELNLKDKILEMFWKRYGILIGETNIRPASYDESCTPMLLEMIYSIGGMSARDMLMYYPADAMMSDNLILRLIYDINPFIGTDSYPDHVRYILDLRMKLKEKPNLIIPFFKYRGVE